LARIGKRDEAINDGREALLLDSDPPTLYQVACIYSQTSKIKDADAKQQEADRVKALNLLSGALRTGFALEWIDTDPDMEPLRKLPDYIRAVAAARALAGTASQPQSR